MPEIIPGYNLEQPSAAELVASLEQILGAEATSAAVSHALCELGRDATSITDLTSAETLEFATILIKQRGLVRVLARSFSIRVHTYQLLASQVQSGAPND